MRQKIRQWIALLGCWGMALGIGIGLIGWPLYKSRQIKAEWVETAAKVISSEVRHGRRGSSSVVVYEYDFGGKSYVSQRVCFPGQKVFYDPYRVTPGSRLRCFVDPEDPAQAILNPDVKISGIMWGVWGTFLVVGILGLFGVAMGEKI